jgi:hypothetical protein
VQRGGRRGMHVTAVRGGGQESGVEKGSGNSRSSPNTLAYVSPTSFHRSLFFCPVTTTTREDCMLNDEGACLTDCSTTSLIRSSEIDDLSLRT